MTRLQSRRQSKPRFAAWKGSVYTGATSNAFATAGTGITLAASTAIETARSQPLQAGDVMILFVALEHATSIVDLTPTGWTKIVEQSAVGGTNISVGLYYRRPTAAEIAEAADASTATGGRWANSSTAGSSAAAANADTGCVAIAVVSGCPTSGSPVDSYAIAGGSSFVSVNTPSVTPTETGQSFLDFVFVSDDAPTFSPADKTSAVQKASTTGGTDGMVSASMSSAVGVSSSARSVSAGAASGTSQPYAIVSLVMKWRAATSAVQFAEAGDSAAAVSSSVDIPLLTGDSSSDLDTESTFLFAGGNGPGSSKTIDSGWTDLGTTYDSIGRVEYRQRDGSGSDNPGSSITTGTGAQRQQGTQTALANVDTFDPIGNVSRTTGTSTTPSFPSLTTDRDGDAVLYFLACADDTTVSSYGTLDPYALIGARGGSGSGRRRSVFFLVPVPTAGTSPTISGVTLGASTSWNVHAAVIHARPYVNEISVDFAMGDLVFEVNVESGALSVFVEADFDLGSLQFEAELVAKRSRRRRPRREFVWIEGIDGEQIGVIR